MDKTYFLEVENIFDNNKLVYKFAQPYKGINADNYAYSVVKQLHDLFKHNNVDINKHISNTNYYFEDGEWNSRILFLNVNLNEGKSSKSHIRNKVGVLQKVKSTPTLIKIYGKNSEHTFTVYNIEDGILENASGIYLFTMQVEDNRPTIEFSHSILKFDSIEDSNVEAIAFAKANGALHFLYNNCGSEYKRQEIIEDIKNGENYQYQISLLPETEYFAETV